MLQIEPTFLQVREFTAPLNIDIPTEQDLEQPKFFDL